MLGLHNLRLKTLAKFKPKDELVGCLFRLWGKKKGETRNSQRVFPAADIRELCLWVQNIWRISLKGTKAESRRRPHWGLERAAFPCASPGEARVPLPQMWLQEARTWGVKGHTFLSLGCGSAKCWKCGCLLPRLQGPVLAVEGSLR